MNLTSYSDFSDNFQSTLSLTIGFWAQDMNFKAKIKKVCLESLNFIKNKFCPLLIMLALLRAENLELTFFRHVEKKRKTYFKVSRSMGG